MTFNLRTLLLAVTVVAGMLGTWVGFWHPKGSNYQLYLATYLLILSSVTVIAIHRGKFLRAGFSGSAVFGLLYFIGVLKCGFGVATMNEALSFIKSIWIGSAFMALAFLAAEILAPLLLVDRNNSGD